MTTPSEVKAVILARGLGTRMRRPDASVALDSEQASSADAGLKALIPVGRAFLDYVLSALADAGFREVCLVIGPEHEAVREYYSKTIRPQRLAIDFAMQERPLGTADALLAAERFVAGAEFVALNSDNYYPVEAYRALRALGQPGLVAFERETLLRESNIPAERVKQYAILHISAEDELEEIIEKPDEATWAASDPAAYISMNIWRFNPRIFQACARVKPSARGELELPQAVQLAITAFGERLRVVRMRAGVLDLSSRADIPAVAARLRDVDVRL
jgi:glucose-1-phosphate thymidylyltransferase